MSKIAFIYPGQGAQAVGMGKDFYEKSPLSRTIFDQASEAVNLDLKKLCFEENEQLDNHTDAREEGKNKYKKQGSVRKKTNKETKRTGGNPVGGSFDMKI